MAKMCIICQKEVEGAGAAKVVEDPVIRFIRSVKGALKVAQNNQLYVCSADLQKHAARRKQFEKDVVIFGVMAVGIIVVLVGLPLTWGRFDAGLLLMSVFFGLIVFLFGAMLKYIPAIEAGAKEAPMPPLSPAPPLVPRPQPPDNPLIVPRQAAKPGKPRKTR